MQLVVSQQIAELSGGKSFALGNLAELPDEFAKEEQLVTTIRLERELWDVPAIFILLVIFCGIEWYLRRRDNLV